MAEVDPIPELERLMKRGGGTGKIRLLDLLALFGRRQPNNASLRHVSECLRQADIEPEPSLGEAHLTSSVELRRAQRVQASAPPPSAVPAEKRRRFSVSHVNTVGSVVGIATAVLGVGGYLASKIGDTDRVDPMVSDIAMRYVASFSASGEFGKAESGSEVDQHPVACLEHSRDGKADNGRYDLCLIVDPAADRGRQVLGSFKRPEGGGEAYDCVRAAKSARLC